MYTKWQGYLVSSLVGAGAGAVTGYGIAGANSKGKGAGIGAGVGLGLGLALPAIADAATGFADAERAEVVNQLKALQAAIRKGDAEAATKSRAVLQAAEQKTIDEAAKKALKAA